MASTFDIQKTKYFRISREPLHTEKSTILRRQSTLDSYSLRVPVLVLCPSELSSSSLILPFLDKGFGP